MKVKNIIFIALSLLFLVTFFFQIIPVFAESSQATDIPGLQLSEVGIAVYTSGYNMLHFGEYLTFSFYFSFFFIIGLGTYLWQTDIK